jgi:hypothetical protein
MFKYGLIVGAQTTSFKISQTSNNFGMIFFNLRRIFQGSANPLIMKVKACGPYNSVLPKFPKSYKLILKLDDTKYYKDKLASNPSIQSCDLLYSNPFLMLISSNSKTVNRLAVDQLSVIFFSLKKNMVAKSWS